MPAKEPDYAYNINTLNKLFAISSVALVGLLFWMFQQDYERPWKKYQRDFREMEKEQAEAALHRTASSLRGELTRLNDAVWDATDAVKAQNDQIQAIGAEIDSLRRELHQKNNLGYQFTKVEVDVLKYKMEDAIHRGVEPGQELLDALASKEKELRQKAEEVKAIEAKLKAKQKELNSVRKVLKDAERAYDAKRADVTRLEKQLRSLGYSVDSETESLKFGMDNVVYGFRNAPLVDFIAPSVKVNQDVVNNITDDYYFAQVRKVDRCRTCHLAALKPGYENEKEPFRTHKGVHENLFLSSLSKHPVEKFGCSVCHGGMSWAVDFLRAYHTPNSEEQKQDWNDEHQWGEFNKKEGHYWDFPMKPLRYVEGACLQCHRQPDAIAEEAKELYRGYSLVKERGCFGCHKIAGFEHERKVGPSLKHVSHKLNADWMIKWVKYPQSSKSHRKMPQIFDLLNSSGQDAEGNALEAENNAEIHALVAYLRSLSQEETFTVPEVSEKGNREVGMKLFVSKGCVACHETEFSKQVLQKDLANEIEEKTGEQVLADLNANLPGLMKQSSFAPPLAGVRSKLDKSDTKARGWLVDWISNPQHYFPGSKMPNFRLSQKEALDLAEYLMTQRDKQFEEQATPPLDEAVLDRLLTDRLSDNMVRSDAASKVESMTVQERLVSLGGQLVRHYGCYGCHEIKGLEQTQGIGTELTTWGNKPVDRLAFGLIRLEHDRFAWIKQKLLSPRSFDMVPAPEYEEEDKHVQPGETQFVGLRRVIRKDRLRMPNFHFTEDESDAIITFVTGLVKSGVSEKFIDRLDGERGDIVRGEQVIAKYNCRGCHQFELEKVTYSYEGESGKRTVASVLGRFIQRGYDEDEEAAYYNFQAWSDSVGPYGHVAINDNVNVTKDDTDSYLKLEKFEPSRGGTLVPTLVAERIQTKNVPRAEAYNYVPPVLRSEGRKVQPGWLYRFLLKPSKIRPALDVVMPTFPLTREEATRLGVYFAARASRELRNGSRRLMLALRDNDWVKKTESGTLSDRLNNLADGKLSYEETKELARDFLAAAPAGPGSGLSYFDRSLMDEYISYIYPFEKVKETEEDYVASRKAAIGKAVLLMSGEVNGPKNQKLKGLDCRKCHLIGEAKPSGEPITHAPQLANVRDRLRPRFILRWLLNPTRVNPGTKMTDFFKDELAPDDYKKNPATFQSILPGSAYDQVWAIKDLLFNNKPLLNWKQ